jgi:hypothetical protein
MTPGGGPGPVRPRAETLIDPFELKPELAPWPADEAPPEVPPAADPVGASGSRPLTEQPPPQVARQAQPVAHAEARAGAGAPTRTGPLALSARSVRARAWCSED